MERLQRSNSNSFYPGVALFAIANRLPQATFLNAFGVIAEFLTAKSLVHPIYTISS